MKLIIVDVDGTLTDGSIIYDDNGNELKKFCVKDAAAFFAAGAAGIQTMILTGRECKATKRRMEELGVHYIFQNVKDKAGFLKKFCNENGYKKEDLGYIGDDLNDLAAMKLCGFIGCPLDSCMEVISAADYVSTVKGGYGAVRDIIERYLRIRGKWENLVNEIYCTSDE